MFLNNKKPCQGEEPGHGECGEYILKPALVYASNCVPKNSHSCKAKSKSAFFVL